MQSIGLFKDVEQVPLREHFSDWLVDALRNERWRRPRSSYSKAAYRGPVSELIPDWAYGLPPEISEDRA